MSDSTAAVAGPAGASHDAGHGDSGHGHGAHPPTNYVKIWAILVGLLIVSVLGPMIGIRSVTLITAFGIACVKAYLVARNFMHINIERRFVVYMVVGMLFIMFLFVGAVSPDVLEHHGAVDKYGAHWENNAADDAVARGLKEPIEGEEDIKGPGAKKEIKELEKEGAVEKAHGAEPVRDSDKPVQAPPPVPVQAK